MCAGLQRGLVVAVRKLLGVAPVGRLDLVGPGESVPVGEGADERVVLLPRGKGALEPCERRRDLVEDREVDLRRRVEDDCLLDPVEVVCRDVVGEEAAEGVAAEDHALELERVEGAEQVGRVVGHHEAGGRLALRRATACTSKASTRSASPRPAASRPSKEWALALNPGTSTKGGPLPPLSR